MATPYPKRPERTIEEVGAYYIGYIEGAREALWISSLRSLKRRFGQVDEATEERMLKLCKAAILKLRDDLWEFASLDDLTAWLNQEDLENLIWEGEQADADE